MKPTLEEVKAYFKNAKEVRNLGCETEIRIIDVNTIKFASYGNLYFKEAYYMNGIRVWDDKYKYAEIISYKEEAFNVSKSFILDAHSSACSTWKIKIEKEFPSLFVKEELVDGKWYFNGNGKTMFLQDGKNKRKGFDAYGNWFESIGFVCDDNLRLATPQEVETALINEAKKRGFKEGNYKCLRGKTELVENSFFYDKETNTLHHGLKESYYNDVFKGGNWAEILPQPTELTVAEIEAKLGFQIKIIK